MKTQLTKSFWMVLLLSLWLTTGLVLPVDARNKADYSKGPGSMSLSARLVQDKVLIGSDGKMALSLNLNGHLLPEPDMESRRRPTYTDMVVVLDRSGSMKGLKLNHARQAISNLLELLSPNDRFALVTYSDHVTRESGLVYTDNYNKSQLQSYLNQIYAGGATNLGSGLNTGIDIIRRAGDIGNSRHLILISDGLANRGITDSRSLGNMAGIATDENFSVSTVGVGYEFNEQLMTTIADHGTGTYYYLENPDAFADMFMREYQQARHIVADSVAIYITLTNGITVLDAGGYPIEMRNGQAVFYPGNLHAGEKRKIFVTLKIPTRQAKAFTLGPIRAEYRHAGASRSAGLGRPLTVACEKDPRKVLSSFDKAAWEEMVIKNDYNLLRENVAKKIKAGKKTEALQQIRTYHDKQKALNVSIGSGRVAANLETDVSRLQKQVNETFEGARSAVILKQKAQSKALQYEGYRERRAK